jgi:hypothetical protein
MQSSVAAGPDASRSREKILTRRANQGHYFIIALLVDAHGPPNNALFGAIAGKKSLPTLKLHRLARGE